MGVVARPRDPEIDGRIVRAARSILERDGYEALTMSAVAAEAGIGKPALYRRYPTRGHLVMAATIDASDPDELPDTGTFAGDLVAALRLLASSLEAAPRSIVGAQMGAAIADRELAERFLIPRARAAMDDIAILWDRAIERGEVDPTLDGRVALRDLSSSLNMHVLVFHLPVDDDHVVSLVDRFLHGVAPKAP